MSAGLSIIHRERERRIFKIKILQRLSSGFIKEELHINLDFAGLSTNLRVKVIEHSFQNELCFNSYIKDSCIYELQFFYGTKLPRCKI